MDAGLASAYAKTDTRIAVLEEMPIGAALANGLAALRYELIDGFGAVRVHSCGRR